MKNNNYEKPEKDNSKEVPIFSDRDLEDSLKVEEEYSKGGETSTEVDSSPQILTSLRRQRRLKRSQRFVILLCIGLGILVVAIFFIMKPGVKKPQIVAEQMKGAIPSTEGEEVQTIPETAGKKGSKEKPSQGGIPEGEKPIALKPAETPIMSRGREAEKKMVTIGETDLPKREKGDKVTEAQGKKPDIKDREEGKSQVAKAEEPKSRTIPGQKPSIARFTINVGSFRERMRAERLMNILKEKGYKAFVAKATISESGTWYRVSVGRFPSRGEAQAFAQALKEKNGIDSFVRELK